MEWMLDVNEILKDDITKITNSLMPPGFEGDGRSIRRMQDSLSRLVDSMGEMSAEEQGLSRVITTADKLRTADSHALYLLRDAAARDGRGEVVGMLKVGRKHLYLYDSSMSKVREVEPLCVLDFYVLSGYQRRGCGKALFDHMLRDTNTSPHQLAVDGPSEKMESFLAKNYGVTRLLRHSNNFAISTHFFDALPPHQLLGKSGAGTPSASQGAVGRYTAHKPHSSIGNVIHGGGGAATAPAQGPYFTDGSEGSASDGAEAAQATAALRPRSLPVPAPAPAPVPAAPPASEPEQTPAGAPSRRDTQLTEKGFYDVKFHHEKLW